MKISFQRVFGQKKYLFFIILIIILAAYLRLTGFNWGLPKEPYFRPGYQDEPFVIRIILEMNPGDLNPHYFINPSFHYYTLLGAIKLCHLLGYLQNFDQPTKLNIDGQPVEKITLNDYQRIFVIGRVLTLIEAILTVLLVYLIGSKLYDRKVGLISSLIFAVLPTVVYQSHFFVVDSPALFWGLLVFYYVVSAVNKKSVTIKWFIITGIFLGLAFGTKYMNILMIFPLITVYFLKFRKSNWKYLILTFIVMLGTFLITTPHSLFSLREFLFGYADGFGGIFGTKGLIAYNSYPTNLIKPLGYIFYYSLRLPLMILALFCIGYAIKRRSLSDKILLSFLIPFYILLVISPSPHLRHSLPVLPFIALFIAGAIIGFTGEIRNNYLRYGLICYTFVAFVYTFLFTVAITNRMKYPDTRYEFADWVFKNIPRGTSIATATMMPFRYTPPIERPLYDGNGFGCRDDEYFAGLYYNLMKVNYDYNLLLKLSPEYFFITEVECREFPYNQVGKVNARNFIRQLFNQTHYKLVRVFQRRFSILGVNFEPSFPNTDWNPVSRKIYLFKRKF